MSGKPANARLLRLLAVHGVAADGIELQVRSATCVDVGSWFGNRRVWLIVAGNATLFVAPGPRPYVETIPVPELANSAYNHVTGCLVCAPRAPACGPLRIPPDLAARVLGRLQV